MRSCIWHCFICFFLSLQTDPTFHVGESWYLPLGTATSLLISSGKTCVLWFILFLELLGTWSSFLLSCSSITITNLENQIIVVYIGHIFSLELVHSSVSKTEQSHMVIKLAKETTCQATFNLSAWDCFTFMGVWASFQSSLL